MECRAFKPDGRFAVGTSVGDVTFASLDATDLAPPFVIGAYIWRFARKGENGCWQETPLWRCPWCGRQSVVPHRVGRMITRTAGHVAGGSEAASSRTVAEEVWKDARLVTRCVECARPVRFTPFVVDNRGDLGEATGRVARGTREANAERGEHAACALCCNHEVRQEIMLLDGRAVDACCLVEGMERLSDGGRAASRRRVPCDVCGRREGRVWTCSAGSFCEWCAVSAVEIAWENEDVRRWNATRWYVALTGRGGLAKRMLALTNREMMACASHGWRSTEREEAIKAVVSNLGYVRKHPLARFVRQLSLDACLGLGQSSLSFLLAEDCLTPWQLHSNILTALAALAPRTGVYGVDYAGRLGISGSM